MGLNTPVNFVCYNREFIITVIIITNFDWTVKLGYNDHGYNEHTVIANNFNHLVWSSMI